MKNIIVVDGINNGTEDFATVKEAQEWIEESFIEDGEIHPDIECVKIFKQTHETKVIDIENGYKIVFEELESVPAETLVSFAEPNQQLFTIAEVESYLERQKEICKQQYNLYCTDRELPISDVCRKMILEAPTPNIVKS